jgi:hypothetical protein
METIIYFNRSGGEKREDNSKKAGLFQVRMKRHFFQMSQCGISCQDNL